jgi:NAD(P)H dehydrogenase (quinone)
LMHCYFVIAHPQPNSFCHALLHAAEQGAQAAGHTTTSSDLYAEGFSPVLNATDFAAFKAGNPAPEIVATQAQIQAADLLVLIYPLWWGGYPAMLKGWIDRVFSFGFAYTAGPESSIGLLTGKRVLHLTPIGQTLEEYQEMGITQALQLLSQATTFGFCGMESAGHHLYGRVGDSDQATREHYLKHAASLWKDLGPEPTAQV